MAVFYVPHWATTMQVWADNTSTMSGYPVTYQHAGHFYQPYVAPATKTLSVNERARLALDRIRTPPRATAASAPKTCQSFTGALAPRRTVVSRGSVSWIRAGTRRPL